MFGFDIAGTSVQFTTQNLFRSIVILFPPAPEVCSRICRQGFEDALRFLTKNHLVPCIECLTVQSNAIPVPSTPTQNIITKKSLPTPTTEPFLKSNRIRILQKQRANSASPVNRRRSNGCELCLGPLGRIASSSFSSIPLPSVVQKTLTDMETRSAAGLLSWLRRWRLIRWWLRLILPPIMLPFELMQFALRKLRARIKKSILAPTEAILLRFQHLIDFILQQIENKYIAPSAVIAVGSPSLIQITESQKINEIKNERKKSIASLQRKISASIEPLDLAIDNYKNVDRGNKKVIEEDEVENGTGNVLQKLLKICQIFDTSSKHLHEQQNHHCPNGIISSHSKYEGSLFDTEEQKGGEDSGLSLAEDEVCEDDNEKRKIQIYLKKNKKRI
ncbi:unnamed protein product [Meloidogyne enterolobii]|uniref:Uncharacterized protein n=2 Tax=Meloidogyne enterolobii TaxID=390850 RepID=A0ACB0YUV9_MELEN